MIVINQNEEETMQYIKLQLGCLLVILYIMAAYVKATKHEKMSCNRIYDALMAVTPLAVIFDGITAWTINHMDIVPGIVNSAAHLIFYILMDLEILITALYMYDQTVGLSKQNRKKNLLLLVPGVISLVLTVAGIGQIYYVQGKMTNYSMGMSAYVCFATLFFYYGIILYLLVARHRFLPKEKKLGTASMIVIVGTILIVQIIYPEVLLTSVAATMLLVGVYIDFENPSIRKLTAYNENMVEGFATMVENRDDNTGGHIRRTKAYVNLILHKMRHDEHYKDIVNKDYLINVSNAAPLHDLGKIATPDRILQKPGKLTDEEFAIMKEHAARGGEIILNTFKNIDNPEFQQIAYEVARFHHEKYNGKGYPDGLAGEQIPIFAMSCRSPVEPCAICCSCRWCLCERRGALEIAPVPSPVIYAMIGYIYVICRYAELILKDVADCTGHFFIIIG